MNWFNKLQRKYRILIAVGAWLPTFVVSVIISNALDGNTDNINAWQSIIVLLLLALGFTFTFFAIKARRIEKQAEQKKIDDIKAKQQQEKQAQVAEYDSYYHFEYNIVGTTFENKDGTHRQKILANIVSKKPPFHNDIKPKLDIYNYDGQSAVGVFVNDVMIGNIAKEDKDFIVNNFDKITIENFTADEFYSKKDNKTIYYAKIAIKAKKDS